MHEHNAAVYPGSYDPLTNGHIDIIERGLKIFGKIVVAVLKNPAKTYLFDLDERQEMLRSVFGGEKRIEVDHFEGLLVDYLKRRKIATVVRGLRAISDFEIEFQMALMNRKIEPRIETIFFVPSESYSFLSSKLVKEIYMLGGEVGSMVPGIVDAKLKEKFRRR
ncbi:MAG: pantetheine-phosphate adenylyltransferase [Acidobacteria bacterium]|jgi:pantetheine-phosphate adenylyltransferase|nr:pantetheine-phosphate adenylyltransferase [Acidobacteriota bacterium]